MLLFNHESGYVIKRTDRQVIGTTPVQIVVGECEAVYIQNLSINTLCIDNNALMTTDSFEIVSGLIVGPFKGDIYLLAESAGNVVKLMYVVIQL